MVEFDTSFALLIWQDAPASIPSARERVTYLVEELAAKKERILIPTPALTELLVRANQASASKYLEEITRSSRFRIGVYDRRAAVEGAAIIRDALKKKDKKDGASGAWSKINFDRQIIAIGKIEQAHTLYTDDGDLGKLALKHGLKVVTFADLPLPIIQRTLFNVVPFKDGTDGNSEQAKAESETAEVQGSGSGPSESQAATKAKGQATEKEKPAKEGEPTIGE